jgi:perosamine synthetase
VIPYGRHHIDEDDIRAVADLLRHGALTQGPLVGDFERAVADYVGAEFAVAVSSGTAALHLAALAAGLGPGGALVTSPITFVASSNAALYVGATPLFADIDPATVNLAPDSLAAVLRRHPETRVVVPVHFAGLPCDMPAIRALADVAGAVVIEDAAHALGATYPDGRRVGCCADSLMTVFSFHPVKAIAAGEGGMITTNDEAVYRRLLRLRSHGINKLDDPFLHPEQAATDGMANPWYYEMQELGFNFRITDIQCALALSQFGKLERFIERRRHLARRYDEAFAGHPAIEPAQQGGGDRSAHHLYVARIDFGAAGVSRADLMRSLRSAGIITQVHYIPVPLQPVYRRFGIARDALPNAAAYYDQALSLPLYYDLAEEQAAQVADTILPLVSPRGR